MPLWEIKLDIEGSLRLDGTHEINDVTLKNKGSNKLQAIINLKANDSSVAFDVAIRKVNDVLDSLSLITNSNLIIAGEKLVHQLGSNSHSVTIPIDAHISRICDRGEIQNAEKILNNISNEERTFLRALGWYRKGLNGIDAFDKFLAYWNSIEIITQKYGPSGDDINGSRDRMISMLNEYLECDNSEFVNELNIYRNNIVHGVKAVELNQIALVSSKIPNLKKVANDFLLNYARKNLLRD